MATLKYQWGKIRSGHIIEFIYNGEKRICIVMMGPNDSGGADDGLLHCLQIVRARIGVPPLRTRLEFFLNAAKGCTIVDFDPNLGPFYKFNIGWRQDDRIQPKQFYRTMRKLIDTNGLYKTFTWSKVKSSSVKLTNDEVNILNVPHLHLIETGGPTLNDCINPVTKKLLFDYPDMKTFRRLARQPQYYEGQVWVEMSGRWKAKNQDGDTKSFSNEIKAMEYATESKEKAKQLSAGLTRKITNFYQMVDRQMREFLAKTTNEIKGNHAEAKKRVIRTGGYKMLAGQTGKRKGAVAFRGKK